MLAHMPLDRSLMLGQFPARPTASSTRGQPSVAVAPLPRLDHVRDTDPQALTHRPRAFVISGQNPVSQILRE
jgi:hypothetical protein